MSQSCNHACREAAPTLVLLPGEKGPPGERGKPGPQGAPGSGGGSILNTLELKLTSEETIDLELEASLVIIDTANFSAVLRVAPAVQPGIYTFTLAEQRGGSAYLRLASGGDFELCPANPRVTLYWDGVRYHILDTPAQIRAFYPNSSNPAPLILPPYTASVYIPGFGDAGSLAVSGDGNTLAVGATTYATLNGGVCVYNRQSDGTWGLQALLSQNSNFAREGTSVALSSNGNTLAVGATLINRGAGGVIVYTREGSNWSYETTLSSSEVYNQGRTVAISADGTTIAMGVPEYLMNLNQSVGGVWIFRKTISGWEQPVHLPLNEELKMAVGVSLAINALGTIVVAGSILHNDEVGGAWIWELINGTWELTDIVSGSGVPGPAHQGVSISLSADGNTLALGSRDYGERKVSFSLAPDVLPLNEELPYPTTTEPSFPTTDSSTPMPETSTPTSNSEEPVGSGEEETGSEGGEEPPPSDPEPEPAPEKQRPLIERAVPPAFTGAAWIFVRRGGRWLQEAGPLYPGPAADGAEAGQVALTADGNTLAVGGRYANNYRGAIWIFRRLKRDWTLYGNEISHPSLGANTYFTSSVAISSDGSVLAASAPLYDIFGPFKGALAIFQ